MKKFLTLILFLVVGLIVGQQKTNVLFIAVDDMKPLTNEYGYKNAITPNLDQLSKSGVTFENAYCQYPVCGPTRASIMTGLRPETNGVLNLKTKMRDVNPNALTIAQHFKNNGYETVARGKIFDPRCVESKKTDDKESWSLPYVTPHGEYGHNSKKLAVESINDKDDVFTDGQTAKSGIKLINELSNKKKPFFVAVGFKKPHLPFVAPKKYFDLYDKKTFDLAPFQTVPLNAKSEYILNKNSELLGYHPNFKDNKEVKSYAPYSPKGHVTIDQQKELLHGYFACVSYIDSLIGDLLVALKQNNQLENTIIILWGDHGMWGKHTTMEQAARVPLIISAPGIAVKNKKTSSLVEFLDVFPTMCDLAGLKKPTNLDGKSLLPILKNPLVKLNKPAITQYKRKGAYGYSMRTDRYRYTEWVAKNGKVMYRDLYDMKKDPNETVNIVENKIQLATDLALLLRKHKKGLNRLK